MQGNSRTKTKLSRNPESTPTVPTYVNVVTSSILSHSTYVPVVNGKLVCSEIFFTRMDEIVTKNASMVPNQESCSIGVDLRSYTNRLTKS